MHSWGDTCILIDSLERGGAQRQLLLFARHLASISIPPFRLIAFREPLTLLPDFKAADVEVTVVHKRSEVDIPFLFTLTRTLAALRPRIVVSFLPTADMWGRLAAKLAGVQTIGCSIRSIPQDSGFAKNSFIAMTHRRSAFIICNSAAAARKTVDDDPTLSGRVHVIQNGIEVSAPKAQTVSGPVRIILVARLVPVKDVATLIRALPRINADNEFSLTIVGDGTSRPELESLAAGLEVTHLVAFIGEHDSPRDLMGSFDIGVLTSLYEGMSNVIMEYMAAGLPVVASNVGGNPELVKDGETGLLFPVGDEAWLARCLSKLIADQNLRARLGSNGLELIKASHSISGTVAAWDHLLHGEH